MEPYLDHYRCKITTREILGAWLLCSFLFLAILLLPVIALSPNAERPLSPQEATAVDRASGLPQNEGLGC